MSDHHDPEELLRTHYGPSPGRNPAGAISAVVAWLQILAERQGVTATPAASGFHPENHQDKSGEAIAAEARHNHHVEQDSARNPDRVTERDLAIASGDTTKASVDFTAAVHDAETLFAEMAGRGFTLRFDMEAARDLAAGS